MARSRKKRATKKIRLSVAVTTKGLFDVIPMAAKHRNPVDPWTESCSLPCDPAGDDFDPDLTHYVVVETEVPLPNADTVTGVRKGRAQRRD